MTVSEGLKHEIRIIEAKVKNKNFKLQELDRELKEARSGSGALRRTMNFRERYLRGWFGGDRIKAARYRSLRARADKLESEMGQIKEWLAGEEQKIQDRLDDFLRESDAAYGNLAKPYDSAKKMKEAADNFLNAINRAISEVGSAQGMETLDLFTKSKAISVMSYAQNSSASSALVRVRQSSRSFQRALRKYNSFLKDYRAPEVSGDIVDGADLIFDFAFDGFDFTSLFTLSQLWRAESRLREAREKASEVDGLVSRCLEKSAKALLAYRNKARSLCA